MENGRNLTITALLLQKEMGTIRKFASLIKFSHTIFAMPFALAAYVYTLVESAVPFDGMVVLKVLLCMIFARNAAMGFNRWADRKIDAKNLLNRFAGSRRVQR